MKHTNRCTGNSFGWLCQKNGCTNKACTCQKYCATHTLEVNTPVKKVDNLHYVISEYWQPEFFDMVKVLEMGAKKHGANNWLKPLGKKADHKAMHDSMFHHLAESFAQDGFSGERRNLDAESGLDPLLHLACRALMSYTRKKRGLE